mmetsp:Transcript_60346/g.176392  ORF Transcript_60346/g.176392 Transcript_60346/m.176392 type:complete len:1544 (-) Transcript_60346:181-4812(-)
MLKALFVIAIAALGTTQSALDQSFEGVILHGVPHLYDANGELMSGLKPLRLLTQRPESGGVGDAMGKLVPVYELVLRAINNGSSVLPGYVVELYLTDSRCAPQIGVQATIKLLNRYPRGFFKAVFGPLCSDPTSAVNDVVQAYNLFQVASISRSPALSNGIRYPFLCRLSPALSFVAEGIMHTVQLFGWTRIGLMRDDRALSDSTIISMYARLKRAKEAFAAGDPNGYEFNLEYSGLNSFIIDSTTDEVAVVGAIKRSKVRVLVGAVYEDAGLRFFCELYKQGYVGKKLQFILATGWWADNWIEEQLGEQTGTTLDQSGGGCTMEQVFEAAKDMASVAQATWFQSPGMSHTITQVGLYELKQSYYSSCSAGEGCHNDFAAADYDGLSTMVNAFDIWLRNSGNLSAIDYDSRAPIQELYDIALQTDFLGVTGRVKFYSSTDLACERQGSFTLKQYSNLPNATGEDGWINRASYTNLDGFGLLQSWIPYHWQDDTETYFGSGTGWVSVTPGVVASFGGNATGLDDVLNDWKYCPAGTTVDDTGKLCISCPTGKYGQGGECRDCPHGTYASREGMELCPNCPAGKYQNETGAANCSNCLAGAISDPESPWQCKACPQGKLSGRDGLDVCDVCDTGKYQDVEGSSECVSCAVHLGDPALWTTGTGATSESECVCDKDYYRSPLIYDGSLAGTCKECPEGMECPDAGSSEEALLFQVGGAPVTQTGIAGVLMRRYPLVMEGFMTKTSEPLQVYRCVERRHCPGGPPGSCGANRNSDEVGCARCMDGAYETSDGLCELCESSNAGLLIAVVVVGGILALTMATFVVNSGTLQQQSSVMAVVIIIGIMFTGIQTLGVYHNLNVIFFEPLSTVLGFMQVFTLNLKMLRMECMFPFSPVSQYLCRQLVPPICAVLIAVICLFKKVFLKKGMVYYVEYVNTVGTMFSIFFLSIVVSAMTPLNCYAHPGDSGSSVLASPSILCFSSEDERHAQMVTVGLISFSFVVVPFMATACWATVMYPRWTASIGPRSSARLWMFRWLFFRFKPEVYFYGIVFLMRNLLICLVPVFPGCRDDPAFQVILMCAFLLGFTCTQTLLKPWRAGITNVADGVLTSMLVLILVCGILATDFTANDTSIAIVGVLVFCFWSGVGVVALGLFAYSRFMARGKPYRFFICHHKAGAGTFARLVKHNLARHPKVKKKVFIDSDDLKDLDTLFETVGNETDTLVILCSREILTRPWCVGEMVTAKAKAVKTIRVMFPTFDPPQEGWIDNYDSVVKDLNCLAERGINLSTVQDTLRWLNTQPMITLPETINASTFEALIEKLVNNGEGSVTYKKDITPRSGLTAVVVDHSNSEAVTTGLLLAQMLMVHFAQDPDKIPFVLPRGEPLPGKTSSVLIICTIGAFHRSEFLKVIMQAGNRQLSFIPIVADERFPFPLGDALQEHRPTAASLTSKPDKLLELIAEVFQVIGVNFFSNQSSEDVLKAAVSEVAMRLNTAERKTFKRDSKFSDENQCDPDPTSMGCSDGDKGNENEAYPSDDNYFQDDDEGSEGLLEL